LQRSIVIANEQDPAQRDLRIQETKHYLLENSFLAENHVNRVLSWVLIGAGISELSIWEQDEATSDDEKAPEKENNGTDQPMGPLQQNIDSLKKLGFIAVSSNNLVEAKTRFVEAAKLTNTDPGVYFGLALSVKTTNEKRSYLREMRKLAEKISLDEESFVDETNYLSIIELYSLIEDEGRIEYIIKRFPEINNRVFTSNDLGKIKYIHRIVCDENETVLRILLRNKVNVNVKRVSNYGTVHYPITDAVLNSKNLNIIKLLIEAGADCNCSSEEKLNNGFVIQHSPLGIAIEYRKSEQITEILINAGADTNRIETECDLEKGITREKSMLAKAAIDSNNIGIVKHLIRKGADFNTKVCIKRKNSTEYIPLLCFLIAKSKYEMVMYFLKVGADCNCYEIKTDTDGVEEQKRTPLSYAVLASKQVDMVRLLINAGADLNQKVNWNGSGENSIFWLAISDFTKEVNDSIRELLTKYYDGTMSRELNEFTTYSIVYNSTDSSYDWENGIIPVLLKAGADANETLKYLTIKNNKSISVSCPLMFQAIVSGATSGLIKCLLKYGADWNNNIIIDGKKTKLAKYGFNKTLVEVLDLKSLGWKGPGLFG